MIVISRRNSFTLSLSLLTVGCSLFGSSNTKLNISINSDAQLNPNPDSAAAPLVIKFYELTAIDAFNTCSFEAVFYSPNDALHSNLLNIFSSELPPSSSVKVERVLDGQAQFLGIVAGYRDISNAKWRLYCPLNVHGNNTVKLIASRLSISFAPSEEWL